MIIGRPGECAWGRGLGIALLLWTPLELPTLTAAVLLLGTSGIFVAAVRYPIGWAGGIVGPLGDAFVFWLPGHGAGVRLQRGRGLVLRAARAAAGPGSAVHPPGRAAHAVAAVGAAGAAASALLLHTLNAIAELVHRDPDAAGRIVARLGAFLRYSLEMSEREAVPLREEIAALQAYLDIVRLRFGDRVAVETRIEPAALSAPVPPLLVQPLVKNALKHGLEPREGPGRLEITARVRERMLHLEVRDDGVGLDAEPRPGAGIGLRNTRDRLEQMYGGAATLTVQARPSGGVAATVVLPAGG